MTAVTSHMVPIGTPAPDFLLPALDGTRHTLADAGGAPALLVAFLSNHCPFVRHIEATLGALAAEYASKGLACVAIAANDTDAYPDDGPDGLAEQARRAGFAFPYLLDTDQQVAAAFRAACTPDLFLYDHARRLAYRGQFDPARPGNGLPVTGESLRAALDRVLAGQPAPEPQQPSIGCSIKWKPGNEPA